VLYSKLPIPLKAYIVAHVALLPAVLWAASRTASWQPAVPDPWGTLPAWILILSACVAGTWKFRMPGISGIQSLVFAVVTLALLTNGVGAAVACAALGVLVTHSVKTGDHWWRLHWRREPVYRHVFNVSHCALVCGISGLAWDAAAGAVPAGVGGTLCRMVLFVGVYFLLNTGGVSVAIAMDRGAPALEVWREHCLFTAPGYFASAVASSLLWLAYATAGPGALILLPGYYLVFRGFAAYVGALRHAEEMTEKVQSLYEREEEANRRKDEFLAMLAHELRNPLTAISNCHYVLARAELPGAKAERNLDIIGRQTRHLKRLVDDLLDVSRITRGVVELRPELLDLRDILASALEPTEPMARLRGHTISVEVSDQPVPCHADPARTEQIFSNLLANAVKYTEPGGRIEVSLRSDDDRAVFRVRDTGIGIEAELLPHVFDLFVQADRSLARSQGGLGIGLTLVKTLVGMHGGTVEAQSAGKDLGSEFIVRLPLSTDEWEAAGSGTCEDGEDRGATVVVVEDNEDAADTLREMLDMWGYRPLVATTGPAGLALARKSTPDVVLLDIGLPDMDGYEIARTLRQESGSRVRLIALTGYGRAEDRDSARSAGFDHHLVKPVNPEELHSVLRRVLAGHVVHCS